MPGDPSEHDQELNLVVAVSEFFDRAIYHTICGYEDARRTQARVQAEPKKAAKAVTTNHAVEPAVSPSGEEFNISRGGDVGEVSG